MVPVVNGLVCYSVFFEFCYDYYNIESVCIQMYVVFSAKIFQWADDFLVFLSVNDFFEMQSALIS